MGKKGSWFSAIKRVFIPNSKETHVNGSEKTSKEKRRGRAISRNGETKSFIPLFREPSSIEKILGEADQQKLLIEQPKTPPLALPGTSYSPRVTSPKAASPRVTLPRAVSSRAAIHQHEEVRSYKPEPTLRYHNVSATKIQAAYRGYMARRNFKGLRGLVRLQGMVRGQNVKRQTMNALKTMQFLVRVQSQIQSRRIQRLENHAFQCQPYKNDKELETTLGKWTVINQSAAGLDEDWDDSLLTKEEIEARLQRKVEAVIKRERAMAYSYSHRLWKANPKSAQTAVMHIRSGGFPWWWNWLDRQLPPSNAPETQTIKIFHLTPPKPSPRPASTNCNQHKDTSFDNLEALMRTNKHLNTPSSRTPTNSSMKKYSKPRTSTAAFDVPLKDDDSLTSCPQFSSIPSYMSATVSAKAKARESSERFQGSTPNGESNAKRRFSFTLTPNFGSLKWNKGSSNGSNSQKVLERKYQSFQSSGDVSIDSAISMPAALGRKPFNRFV